MQLTKPFSEISLSDLPQVGGKNSSLGEMFQRLKPNGINVPDGFATTADAYWNFLDHNRIKEKLASILATLDNKTFNNLTTVGQQARDLFTKATLPQTLRDELVSNYNYLVTKYGSDISLAVRSSATAEDLPEASFAGQQETYLNIRGKNALVDACVKCYQSLFTDRAIKYREDNKFEHMQVALSIGVQVMVRSDKSSSGVIFTLDPDSGFRDVVLVTGSWGLGENVVKGNVNPDEFLVFKPTLKQNKKAIVNRKLGDKIKTMVYATDDANADSTINIDTPIEKQKQFVLNDDDVMLLARWSVIIEEHYGKPMDIEWAKDGITNELFILQARPETVYSRREGYKFTEYKLKSKGKLLCEGMGLGNKIKAGKARIILSPSDAHKLNDGEVLVTEKTDPDWDPIMKRAAAVITDQGGRTSHAAIVARELGAAAVIGTGNATRSIKDGQDITVSCADGNTGKVYDGILQWTETNIDTSNVEMPDTNVMFILGDPAKAFQLSMLPNNGVGLMRMEFIINDVIRIHPMALKHFDKLEDQQVKQQINELTFGYKSKEDYFVQTLAEATAQIAAAFYPKEVIVRTSDFKSNEYANLIGGKQFEPMEENPMIGFRGASRYYQPLYREAFELECKAMKAVRDDMGLTNVKIMIPFCRTLSEADKVMDVMKENGLVRGENGLQLYMMIEIPSNVILAEEFAKRFDGFSIGSNDLTQLTLGADRDSQLLSEIFDPFDAAVKRMIEMAIEKAKLTNTPIGLCGQAPSDYPEYARFLVEQGITSISFNPDALLKGIENICKAESMLTRVIA